MSKVKCLECGMILESKKGHDFQQCKCRNQTFVDGGCGYLRCGGVYQNKVEVIPEEVCDETKCTIENKEVEINDSKRIDVANEGSEGTKERTGQDENSDSSDGKKIFWARRDKIN